MSAVSVAALLVVTQLSSPGDLPGDLHGVVRDVGRVQDDAAHLSSDVAKLTGAQLSPLFMIGALGGYRWMRATDEERARLPWHERPWFWGAALGLTVLLWAGDKIPVLRHLVKHLKLLENHVSGVLAAVILATSFASAASSSLGRVLSSAAGLILPSAQAAVPSGGGMAAVVSGSGYAAAMLLGILASGAVWLAGHAVNVLVLLSPFAPLDWVLRTARLALGGLVVAAGAASPTLAWLASLSLLAVAIIVAGWAFRLMVLGSVFSTDFLLARNADPGPAIEGFATSVPGVPRRSYGRVARTEGGLDFRYRPWLLLPPRSVPVQAGAVARGILSPVLLTRGLERVVIRFPPRLRGRAVAVGIRLGLSVVDAPSVRGLKAAWAWVTGGSAPVEAQRTEARGSRAT